MAALAGRDTALCSGTTKLTAAQWTHEGEDSRNLTFELSCPQIRGS